MRYAVWRLPGSGESSAQLSRGASLSTHGTSSRCSQRSATACMGDFLSEPIVERCHDYRARGARRPGEEWAAGGGAMGAAARSADPPRALVPVLAGASLWGQCVSDAPLDGSNSFRWLVSRSSSSSAPVRAWLVAST